MSFKSFLQFFDAPLAIVVGGVATALIVGQLAAISLVAQTQVDQADSRQQHLRTQRSAVTACLETQPTVSYASCVAAAAGHASAQAAARTVLSVYEPGAPARSSPAQSGLVQSAAGLPTYR